MVTFHEALVCVARLRVVVCIALVVAWAPAAVAVGGAPAVGGIGVSSAHDSSGARHIIELRPRGDYLVGDSAQSSVARVVVFAPGATASRLYVREIRHSPAIRSLLLVGEAQLEPRTRRITLVLRGVGGGAALHRQVAERWRRSEPQHLGVPGTPLTTADAESESETVFVVEGTGLYWIAPPDATRALRDMRTTAASMLQGRTGNGLLPVVAGALALFTAAGLSSLRHRREAREY